MFLKTAAASWLRSLQINLIASKDVACSIPFCYKTTAQ
jgi:hypothetical protein